MTRIAPTGRLSAEAVAGRGLAIKSFVTAWASISGGGALITKY